MSEESPRIVIEPRFRITIGHKFVFGPGKAQLLELIDATGSISEAARTMGMSYMRAWTLVKSLERGLAEPLVRAGRGGRVRGGAALTETGRAMVRLYRELEAQSAAAARLARGRLAPLLRN